jgi:hypothetical protein
MGYRGPGRDWVNRARRSAPMPAIVSTRCSAR